MLWPKKCLGLAGEWSSVVPKELRSTPRNRLARQSCCVMRRIPNEGRTMDVAAVTLLLIALIARFSRSLPPWCLFGRKFGRRPVIAIL